jgi:phosphoglycerol transferase
MTTTTPPAVPTPTRWARARRGLPIKDRPAGAVAAMALSLIIAGWVLHLGRANLSLPWSYAGEGDTKFYLLLIKGILGHGWFQGNPSLGAPFGLQLYDFPQGADNLNLLVIKALGLFSSNPAWVLNVFFLLTFPLTAASAYLVLRALGVSAGAAVVCAVIFTLLPYHFYRGEEQVLLSAYYSVPLGALLFLRLWEEPGLFARRAGPDRSGIDRSGIVQHALSWLSRRTLLTVALCIVIGSASLYYAVFALVLLLAGSVVALAGGAHSRDGREAHSAKRWVGVPRRGRRAAASGLLASLLIAAMLAINLAPTLIYQAEHGKNTSIARTTLQSDQFGLRLSDLVLPVQQNRLPFLSDVNQRYTEATSTGYCEACFENLGAVGSAGFLSLCLLALVSIVGVAGAFAGRADRVGLAIYRSAALGVALSFAIATIGGVSSLIAFFLTRDIRGWNRISLFIAFFSLLAIALLLDAAIRRLSGSRPGRRGRILAGILLAGTLLLGALDETSTYFVPKYAKDAREWQSDGAFVKQIQARMPSGASIFQLPYVPFPEGYGSISTSVSVPNTTFNTTYELARGYIHSEGLRWSYGAMKGRAADWQGELASKPLYLSLAAAAADGFQGLWVDPHGYDAKARKRLAPLLSELLGSQPLYSPAHDLLFFDLRPFAQRLLQLHTPEQVQALRYATLYPLRTACESDGLELTNPSHNTRTATLTMRLRTRSITPTTMLVHYPGGAIEQVTLEASDVAIAKQVNLPPGDSLLRFSLPGIPIKPAARVGGLVVEQPTLTEDALTPFETARRGSAGAQMPAGTVPPPCQQTVAAVHPIK